VRTGREPPHFSKLRYGPPHSLTLGLEGATMNEAMSGVTPTGESALVGSWRLISCVLEDVETGERTKNWGEHPNAYLVITASGRLIVVQSAEGRKVPKTAEDQSAAFRSSLAYTGRYRVHGSEIVTTVDVAWDEAWVGTEQLRYYRFEGDRLHIEAAPQRISIFGDKLLRAHLVWEREPG